MAGTAWQTSGRSAISGRCSAMSLWPRLPFGSSVGSLAPGRTWGGCVQRVWKLAGAPEHLLIDLDATLIASHSEKQGAAGNFKGGYGFHPILAYADETGEALAGELRPGNAEANTAIDQIRVAEQAIAQIPVEHIEAIVLLLRVDSAGASHE